MVLSGIWKKQDGSKDVKGDDGKTKTVKVYDKTNATTRKRLAKSRPNAKSIRRVPCN